MYNLISFILFSLFIADIYAYIHNFWNTFNMYSLWVLETRIQARGCKKHGKKKKRYLFSPIVQPEPTQLHGNTATSYPPPSLPQPSSKWSLPAASQVILLKSMLTITLPCLKYLRDSSVKFKMAWHYWHPQPTVLTFLASRLAAHPENLYASTSLNGF